MSLEALLAKGADHARRGGGEGRRGVEVGQLTVAVTASPRSAGRRRRRRRGSGAGGGSAPASGGAGEKKAAATPAAEAALAAAAGAGVAVTVEVSGVTMGDEVALDRATKLLVEVDVLGVDEEAPRTDAVKPKGKRWRSPSAASTRRGGVGAAQASRRRRCSRTSRPTRRCSSPC